MNTKEEDGGENLGNIDLLVSVTLKQNGDKECSLTDQN